jgi:NADH-quinone oxidoreductase subunit L
MSVYFFLQINQTHQAIQIQLFDWIQISNFKVDFGFLLDQLSILWLLFCYWNWRTNSHVLHKLHG